MADLVYKSWFRTGAAATVTDATTLAARAAGSLSVSVLVNEVAGAAQTIAYTVQGPGDVIGLQPSAIRRIWPAPGDTTAAENLFPQVEFHAADLPWRYTPRAPSVAETFAFGRAKWDRRLAPWLALLALREEWEGRGDVPPEAEWRPTDPSAGLPPKVVIAASTPLPDLAHAWAWAHVEHLADDEENALSRILCTRRLAPKTRYLMVLVPTWDLGVQAGLGQSPSGAGAPAWTSTRSGPLTLPVYHHWRFQTGEAGDVESFARMLRLSPSLPAGVGQLRLDLDLGLPQGPLALELGTALGDEPSPGQSVPAPRAPTLLERVAVVEALGLDGAAIDPESGDPLVAMPLYGEAHRASRRRTGRKPGVTEGAAPVDPSSTGDWYHQLNADPRWRVAAGLGAAMVQRHQEEFMEQAWSWLTTNRAAVARAQLRAEVQYSWRKRAVKPTLDAAATGGGAASWGLHRLAPMLGQQVVAGSKKSAHPAAEAQLQRLLRPSSRLGRTIRKSSTSTTTGTTGSKVGAIVGKITNLDLNPPVSQRLSAVSVTTASASVSELLAMSGPLARLRLASQFEIETNPPMPHVRIYAPGATLVSELSTHWVMAGASALDDHSVYLLRPNRSFIESCLAGMNHEMAREMLWREFPTDGRGTVFAHFWESLAQDDASSGLPPADIKDLDQWGTRSLGNNHVNASDALVLLLKTPLFRLCPGLVLFLAKSKAGSTDWETTVAPIFHGNLGTDVNYFGFNRPWASNVRLPTDWTFVLQQQPTAPVFGLDLSSPAVISSPQDLSWATFLNPAFLAPSNTQLGCTGNVWKGNVSAASFARCTYQAPVRILIPASDLLAAP